MAEATGSFHSSRGYVLGGSVVGGDCYSSISVQIGLISVGSLHCMPVFHWSTRSSGEEEDEGIARVDRISKDQGQATELTKSRQRRGVRRQASARHRCRVPDGALWPQIVLPALDSGVAGAGLRLAPLPPHSAPLRDKVPVTPHPNAITCFCPCWSCAGLRLRSSNSIFSVVARARTQPLGRSLPKA